MACTPHSRVAEPIVCLDNLRVVVPDGNGGWRYAEAGDYYDRTDIAWLVITPDAPDIRIWDRAD